jgi:hypothetical protein
VLLAACVALPAAAPLEASVQAAGGASLAPGYGFFDVGFEANLGQAGPPAVRFLYRGPLYTLWLTPTEEVIRLRRSGGTGGAGAAQGVVRLRLDGADPGARWTGEEPLAARSNYFIGADPRGWRTGVARFAHVRAAGVWPGIDLVVREKRRQVEYDLVLAPGADPARIRFGVQGADSIAIGAQGEVILHTAAGDLVQSMPAIYQQEGGRRRPIEGRWIQLALGSGAAAVAGTADNAVIADTAELGFAIGPYDRTRPLVIDPTLVYSTYLGGGGALESVAKVAVDGAGNAYITGTASSAYYPGFGDGNLGGAPGAFVTKIDATGTAVVYSSYLGGDAESLGYAIAVDGAGSAYVTGITSADNFPGASASTIQPTLAGGEDAFVTKLNAAGSAIVYSTYLGGSGLDQGWGIAVDGAGNAYVAGYTESADFRGVSAASIQSSLSSVQSGFVTKLNAAGTAIVYSTYLGGNSLSGVNGIAVDGSGSAIVVGDTAATTFPGVTFRSIQPSLAGEFDAFVTKIDSAGTGIVYSTFLGGAGIDSAQSVALDGAGNAYVAGYSQSSTFSVAGLHSIQPQSAGAASSGFVAKIDATGSTLVYLTFLGGSSTGNNGDFARAVAVDPVGTASITGTTTSTAFPGVGPSSLQPTLKGKVNAFLTQIDPQGTAIVYSTYLGGSGGDFADALAVDGGGNVYLGGYTTSADFPVAGASPIQPAFVGVFDAFLTKISMGAGFYTLPPCRLIDTRGAAGHLGGPKLQANAQRTFAVTGICGVPATARVLSVNVTITQPGAAGYLRLFPAGTAVPATSLANFAAGQTLADNAMLLLGAAGFTVQLDSVAAADFILDVNGYFQ